MVTADHRRQAKVVNFGIVYGLSAFGLSQRLGISQVRQSNLFPHILKNIAEFEISLTAHWKKHAATKK